METLKRHLAEYDFPKSHIEDLSNLHEIPDDAAFVTYLLDMVDIQHKDQWSVHLMDICNAFDRVFDTSVVYILDAYRSTMSPSKRR